MEIHRFQPAKEMDDRFTSLKGYLEPGTRICGLPQQLVSGEVTDGQISRDSENLSVQEEIGQENATMEA